MQNENARFFRRSVNPLRYSLRHLASTSLPPRNLLQLLRLRYATRGWYAKKSVFLIAVRNGPPFFRHGGSCPLSRNRERGSF